MQIQDLTVEVRDGSYKRIGQLLAADLNGLLLVLRYNNVGSWSIKLPSNHRLVDELRLPGAGIIVQANNDVIFSGYTTSAKLDQSVDNPLGDWSIEGVDDSVILSERLAYPNPASSDMGQQLPANDDRSGTAETVIKGYVLENISSAAVTDRAIANLIVEESLERGQLVSASARFDNLQELIYKLAQTGGVGFRVEQQGDLVEFQVYDPQDRSGTVRMDLQNGKLTQTEYSYGQPKITRVVVGGAGEAEERLFYEGTTPASLEAESLWMRRVERFVDDRGSQVESSLQQAANEALVDDGKTIVNLSVTPSDDQTMRFGIDWYLGDKITVVVGLVESTAIVTEVGLSVSSDGVRLGVTVGTPVALDYESKLISAQQTQATRISNLERNTTGYGTNTVYTPIGGSTGTQPVFTGPAISGSYNRFGNLIHFSIRVDFTNISSFGTGQYYLTLPYPAFVGYQFRDGCLHDISTGIEYQISGHVYAGSNQLFLSASDKVGSSIQDVDFTSTVPTPLMVNDIFHIAGLYQIEH